MIIDTHAHIVVPEITLDAAPDETWRPSITWENGQQLLHFRGKTRRSALRPYAEVEALLEAHVAAGVDHVLLTPWSALLGHDLEPEEGLRVARIQNQALSDLTRRYPDRFNALGTVPLQDIDLAIAELHALMRQPGLYGVEVGASVRGLFLGDDRFRPFWEAVDQAGAIVFIHPTTGGLGLSALDDYYMGNSVGNPVETALVAAQLVMSGLMEEHPNLKIILAHGGGAILSLRGRLRHAHSFQPKAQRRLKESPIDSLRRFYYDTVTHDADLLRQLVDFAGSDHVVLGSDYPYDMGYDRPADFVRSASLPPDVEDAILSGNAARLLGLGR